MSDVPAMDELEVEAAKILADSVEQATEELFTMINVLGQTLESIIACSSFESIMLQIADNSVDRDNISDDERKAGIIGAHIMFMLGTLVSLMDTLDYEPHVEIREGLMAEAIMFRVFGMPVGNELDKKVREVYGFSTSRLALFGTIGHVIAKHDLIVGALSRTSDIAYGEKDDDEPQSN